MAQSQVAPAHPPRIDTAGSASEKELHAIQQYERIVQFRDLVLSGNHPTVKLPPGVLATTQSPSRPKSAAQLVPGRRGSLQARQPVTATVPSPSIPPTNAPDASSAKRIYGSGSTEINPVLLEKSTELIRAEFNLQRQRLERELKAEVEQRRGSKQERPEPLADFDLTEVLQKALERVQATTALPEAATGDGLATNDEAVSDSFDDNTFYSSKHGTPESHLTSRLRSNSNDFQASGIPGLQSSQVPSSLPSDHNEASSRNDIPGAFPHDQVTSPQASQSRPGTLPNTHSSVPGQFRVPGLNNYTTGDVSSGLTTQMNTSAEQSQSDDSGNAEPVHGHISRPINAGEQPAGNAYVDTYPPSPLIRTHEMIPVAPQPAPVPPYVLEQQWGHAVDQGSAPARGAPAQVAALRNEPVAVNSPESSPQSGRGSDKKKGKKKKRKADRQAPEDIMPYIKPEPRSPSPISAPNIRPNKRQRQSHMQGNELDHGGQASARNLQPREDGTRPYQQEPAPVGYGPAGSYPQRVASSSMVGDPRYGGTYVGGERPLDETYGRRISPRYVQRPTGTPYPPQPVSRVYLDDSQREPYDQARMSVRPDAEPYVGQPMPPPAARIIVDSFGREYIEPPRPAIRQSMAPGPSHGPEIMYDQPPPRAVSRHPGPGPYDDQRGLLYTRASSAYPGHPRRVVTQPEYAPQSARDDGVREFSSRPTAPATEYVQVIPPSERQMVAGSPREYHTRSASTRPAEPVRYEMPREYGHIQTAQPQTSVREYNSSMYAENRRELAQPYVVDYGARPIEKSVYLPGFGVRPVERYYEQPPPPRQGEDIAYIERPRGATQEIVYADDGRREVYR